VLRDDAPLFLVGFMGAGKTTVGQALARLLAWDFLDLDDAIVAAEGRDIARIFAESGEAHFRERERVLLAGLEGRRRLVVACGGGTYASAPAAQVIDRLGTAVWLEAPLGLCLRRAAHGPPRPLLKGPAQAEALYRSRLPRYLSAPVRLDVERLTPEEAAERIVALLDARGAGGQGPSTLSSC
jgi:shikimate kinase